MAIVYCGTDLLLRVAVGDSAEGVAVARPGRTGTAFVARTGGDVPAALHVTHGLTAVRVRDTDLGQVLAILAADSGHTVTLSDKGRYYQGTEDLVGGLPALVAMLRDPVVSVMLDAYAADATTLKGIGVVLGDRRRYLRLADVRRTLAAGIRRSSVGSVPAVRATMDRLIRQGVLGRGLVLKCARCRHTGFQPMARLTERFTCDRCLSVQDLDAASWCHTPPHEPSWFYRLDELVRSAVVQGLAGPALALARLGAEAPEARHHWSFEVLAGGTRPVMEIDFASLVDGVLSAGEAKTVGTLDGAKEVRKTVAGAGVVQADQVVFASTRTWSQETRNRIAEGTRGLRDTKTVLLEELV